MDRDGLITIQSRYTPEETMQRLETAVKSKGMTLFAHIDHAAGAAEVGMTLRPTDLLIFGSPKGGTPLMQSAQTIGIDLPLKVLVSGGCRRPCLAVLQRPRVGGAAPRGSGRHGSCGSDHDRRPQGNRYRGNIRLAEEITATALVSNANEIPGLET
jgi:uncharacterized protein (DUF302 family)